MTRQWIRVAVVALAAAGCKSATDAEMATAAAVAGGPASRALLEKAMDEGRAKLAAKEWVDAWKAFDRAGALDTARAHNAELGRARLAIGKALAIDGARVDLFGLLPDRRKGIDYLLATAARHRYDRELAAEAYFYAARAYRLIDEPDTAANTLKSLVRQYGDTAWAESAEYERVWALRQAARDLDHDLEPLEESLWRLQMYLDRYPSGRNRETAEGDLDTVAEQLAERDFRTAGWYAWNDKPDAARLYYEGLRRRFPKSPWAKRATDQLAALPPPTGEPFQPPAAADRR